MATVAASSAAVASVAPQNKAYDGLRRTSSPASLPSLRLKGVRSKARVTAVAGDVSAEGTTYLIAGAVAIGLIGTALPFIFSRKDTCPECGGAGFIRKDVRLNANAARKDDAQIVCPTCKGLGKLNQVDK